MAQERTYREELEDQASAAGLIMVPELNFDHCVY